MTLRLSSHCWDVLELWLEGSLAINTENCCSSKWTTTTKKKTKKGNTYTFNYYYFSKLSLKDKGNKRIIYVYSSVTHKNIIKVLNLSKEMWCTKLNSVFSWKGVPSERSSWYVRDQFWSPIADFFKGWYFGQQNSDFPS